LATQVVVASENYKKKQTSLAWVLLLKIICIHFIIICNLDYITVIY